MSEFVDYHFANCVLRRWNPDYCETIWQDGEKTPALFDYGTASFDRAYNLSYGKLGRHFTDEVRRMHLEHEISHTLLSEVLGRPYSLTLWHVAHRPFYKGWAEEEAMVLAFQRYVNTGEVLPELSPFMPKQLVELKGKLEEIVKVLDIHA